MDPQPRNSQPLCLSALSDSDEYTQPATLAVSVAGAAVTALLRPRYPSSLHLRDAVLPAAIIRSSSRCPLTSSLHWYETSLLPCVCSKTVVSTCAGPRSAGSPEPRKPLECPDTNGRAVVFRNKDKGFCDMLAHVTYPMEIVRKWSPRPPRYSVSSQDGGESGGHGGNCAADDCHGYVVRFVFIQWDAWCLVIGQTH